jgi:UDP-glucose 4-epimerase
MLAPPRAGDVRESLADISLARELLDYQPTVGFDEGLARTIEYYRSVMEKN